MKSKLFKSLIFTVILMLSLSALFSCKLVDNIKGLFGGDSGDSSGDNTGDGGGTDDGGDSSNSSDGTADDFEGAVFSPDTLTYVIRNSGDTDRDFLSYIAALRNAIEAKTGKFINMTDDLSDIREHEIVLGNTERDISEAASLRMRKILMSAIRESYDEDKAYEDLEAYTVYASGGSVAIVWSDNRYRQDAIEYFVENFVLDSSLVLKDGYSSTVVVSTSKYLEAKEEAIYAEAWAKFESALREEFSADIVSSMKALYSLYTDDMYVWLANLYDPDICVCDRTDGKPCLKTRYCGGGGFYATNSGRDTIGYLPDIENTSAGLSFITSTGMYDGYVGDVMPDWLKEKVAKFVRGLQEPDGYFYHPQWGENVTTSRKGRDLSSAMAILRYCGVDPIYSYPGAASSSVGITRPLNSGSVATLVSSVVVYTAAPQQFQSVENYEKYLNDAIESIKRGERDFYNFGNEIQSQVKQIQSFSKTLGVDLLKMTTDVFTDHQSQSTGLWSDKYNYNATNGFHKVSDVYNGAGVAIPNAELAVESAMRIMSDESLSIIAPVEIYNAWSCIGYVIKNIRNYAEGTPEEREERIAAILDKVYPFAADAIYRSYEMIIPARMPDGSFSYSITGYGGGAAQGSPTGVPNTYEGDVNGNALACTSLTSHIYQALDIAGDDRVPIFTEVDLEKYLSILETLDAVEKDPMKTESTVYDFEDATAADDIPTELVPSDGTGGGKLSIETDDTGNKYLKFQANDLSGTTLSNPNFEITTDKLSSGPNKVNFEMDITFEDGKGLEFLIYGNKGLIMQLSVSVKDGLITVKNTSDSSNVLLQASAKKTLELRFEYVWFADGTGYLAVYNGDDELPSGVTTALYPVKGKHQELTYIHIGASRASSGVTRIDNLRLESVYVNERELEMPAVKDNDRILYDFENMDEDLVPIAVSNGSREEGTDNPRGTATVVGDDDKYVYYVGKPAIDNIDRNGDGKIDTSDREPGFSQPSIKAYANNITKETNRSLVSMDLNFIESADSNFNATMYVYSVNGFLTQLNFSVSGGAVTLKADSDSSNVLLKVAQGKEFKLTVDYDPVLGYIAVYVNGSSEPSGVTTVLPASSKGHGALNYVQLGSSRSNSGIMTVDNVIVENYMDTSAGDDIPTPPPPSSVVYDFEDMEVGETNLFPLSYTTGEGELVVAEDEDGNRYLKYVGRDNDGTLGNPSIKLEPNAIDKTQNMGIIEFCLKFDDVQYAVAYIEGLIGGAMLQINFNVRGDDVVVTNYSDPGRELYRGPKSEYVKMHMEFFWTAEYYSITFNDSDKTYYNSALYDSTKTYRQLRDVLITTNKTTVGSLRLDNLVMDTYYVEDIPPMPIPEYTLDYIVDGEKYHSVVTEYNAPLTLPAPPVKDGYAFDGWFFDDGVFSKPLTESSLVSSPLSDDTAVYAKFSVIIPEYDLTFIVDGEEYYSLTTEANAKITLPASPDIDGKVFAGWYFDDGVWERELTEATFTEEALTGDASVYARLLTEYTVTFSLDGEAYHTVLTTGKEYIILPVAPEREGYAFVGWFLDEGVWSEQLTRATFAAEYLTGDVTVYAYFYELSEGESDSTVTDKPDTDDMADAWLKF